MQHHPLVECGAQCPMQAILEVQLLAVFDHVGEQIAVIGGIFGQKGVEVQSSLGCDQLVQPNGTRRKLRPFPLSRAMVGIGPSIADTLEDHASAV